MLAIDERRFFFFHAGEAEPAEWPEFEDEPAADRAGWRGWLIERWHRLQTAWAQSENKAAAWSRGAWRWLHSWVHPDEAMLTRLRQARRIELHHPKSRSPSEVRSLWDDYLNHRWWRHVVWMGANGLVAPPALAMLWILPGPNLIGYWFAYRAIRHALIIRGIRRVRRGEVPLELFAVEALDQPVAIDEQGKAAHTAIEGSAPGLDEHVHWTASEPSVMVEPGPAPPDDGQRDDPSGDAGDHTDRS